MNIGYMKSRDAERGFTLIELMIALVLGLIVIAGVSSVFLANQRSYRTNNALAEVQNNSRISFELMSRDIRQAGLTGCDNSSGRIANVLNNSPTGGGTDWWANWGNALHGYTGGDPALTDGTAVTNHVAGTDSLQIMGTDGSGLSVASDQEPAANFKLNETTSTLQTGDIIIVCSPDHATIVQISSYNNANVTLVHNSGNSIVPGNCIKGLGYPTVCKCAPGQKTGCSSDDNGNIYQFPNNSQIAKMAAVDWYLGYNGIGTGTMSLYRQTVGYNSTTSTVSGTPQEMVRNVTSMTIAYHQAGNVGFVRASSVTNWSLVDAAQVTLQLQSTDARAGVNTQALTNTYTATSTVRNRVL